MKMMMIVMMMMMMIGSSTASLSSSSMGREGMISKSQRNGDTFDCDGEEIGVSVYNDDYCDCEDGSDEPGTSACSHISSSAQFYCVNENHISKSIFTSRVDDGICDCCDGSDESSGDCENTCEEEARAYRLAHMEEQKRFDAGAEKKKALLQRAKSKRIEMKKKVEELTETLRSVESELEELREEEKRVKKEHDDTKEKRKQEGEAKLLSILGLSGLSHEDFMNIIFELGTVSEQYVDIIRGQVGDTVAKNKQEADGDGDDDNDLSRRDLKRRLEDNMLQKQEEEEEEEGEGDIEERHVRLSHLLHDKDFDAAAAILSLSNISEKETRNLVFKLASLNDGWAERIKRNRTLEESGMEESSWFDRYFGSSNEKEEESEKKNNDDNKNNLAKTVEAILNTMSDSFEPNAVSKIKNKIRELDKKKIHTTNEKNSNTEKLESTNWGSDNVWLALLDECFELKSGEFTYKICIGGEARQGTTKLGDFKKWEGSYETMVYENGEKCWKGPKRSIRVKVRCGPETKLLSVEEPEMCVYASEFETPAACGTSTRLNDSEHSEL